MEQEQKQERSWVTITMATLTKLQMFVTYFTNSLRRQPCLDSFSLYLYLYPYLYRLRQLYLQIRNPHNLQLHVCWGRGGGLYCGQCVACSIDCSLISFAALRMGQGCGWVSCSPNGIELTLLCSSCLYVPIRLGHRAFGYDIFVLVKQAKLYSSRNAALKCVAQVAAAEIVKKSQKLLIYFGV